MPERTVIEWLADNWRMWITVIGFLFLGKNVYDTSRRLDRAVFDTDGSYRLVKLEECEKCRLQCQSAQKETFQAVESAFNKMEGKLDTLISLHMQDRQK